MNKTTILLTTVLLSSTPFISPAFASKSDGDDKRKNYQEHYQQRHQMNMDMMQMLAETMTILRDLDTSPSAEQKARLGDMVKQMEEMMSSHKMMGDKGMQRMDKHMKGDGRGKHHDWN